MESIFWTLVTIVVYTYIGYGIIITIWAKFKRKKTDVSPQKEWPAVTLFVAAYNELSYLPQKVANFKSLDYPQDKIQILFVTDGSNDGSEEFLKSEPGVEVAHVDARGGKIGALNRGFQFVKNDIIIYSDANTDLNKDCVKNIVRHFNDPKVGCVAGEKRIKQNEQDNASGAGEGLYWKYESYLKKKDDEVHSCIGAAGELFAIRKELHEEVEKDTVLDDFIISMRIVLKGFKIKYEPEAFAIELPSENTNEELKRKIRIAAGGLQSISRLPHLLKFHKHFTLSFQYLSHRVLRWTIAPLCLPLLLFLNFFLAQSNGGVYTIFLTAHIVFYLTAVVGYILKTKNIKAKKIFIPFYFLFMNYAVFAGALRFIKGSQSAVWEKAKRAS